MTRMSAAGIALMLTLVGCATVQQTDSTLPPLEGAPGLTSPTPTIGDVDITAPVEESVSIVNPSRAITAADVPPPTDCVVSALPAEGQLTFAFSDIVYALNPDATLTCLADLASTPAQLQWSPDGDEVLLSPQRLLRADGTVADTQFSDSNIGISWSQPTGKALITPNPATGQLFWRNAGNLDERLDITFTNGTIAAAYHPSGTQIAAIGTGVNDGKSGVFIASNRGEKAQRVDSPDDGRPTELAFDMSGSSLVLVHKHSNGGGHVHRYLLGSGDLLTIASTSTVPVGLSVSTVDEGDVAWVETPAGEPSVLYTVIGLDATDPVPVSLPAETIGTPLGWLPGHRLMIAVRPVAASARGNFDLWIWTPAGSSLIATGVAAAGPRVTHGPWSDPPGLAGGNGGEA